MKYKIEKLIIGDLQSNTYILYSDSTKSAFIIDPGDEPEKIISTINKLSLNPELIILTHCHTDHCGGALALAEHFKTDISAHELGKNTLSDPTNLQLAEMLDLTIPKSENIKPFKSKTLTRGDLELEIIQTPGHTPCSVCLKADKMLFTGDTLFASGIGRTDLPGGSARVIGESLNKICSMDDNIEVYPGHGPATTIGKEKRENPFLN